MRKTLLTGTLCLFFAVVNGFLSFLTLVIGTIVGLISIAPGRRARGQETLAPIVIGLWGMVVVFIGSYLSIFYWQHNIAPRGFEWEDLFFLFIIRAVPAIVVGILVIRYACFRWFSREDGA